MEPANPYASPLTVSREADTALEERFSLLAALRAGTSLYFRRLPTIAAITLSICVPMELFVSYQEYFVLDPEDVLGVIR